jgi:ribonuclease BN (tRNA processing enzyme)
MKLTVLGSGGWIPTPNNETACYMIESGDDLILLDAGTGLSNLEHYHDVLRNFDTIHIVLSHYHLDHIIGLSFLPVFFKDHTVWIYGPGEPAYPGGVRKTLNDFFSEPFSSSTVEELIDQIYFKDYTLGAFSVGNVTIEAFRQVHAHISYGLKVGNDLYYATDTMVLNETFEHASDVKLLLHECWEIESAEDPFHTSLDEFIRYLPAEPTVRIGLIHRNPRWNQHDLMKAKARIGSRDIELIEDHQVIYL